MTPPARRRPWKLAREAMSVDVVSGGRLVLPIGLGAIDDGAFGRVGEPTEKRVLAERMDESLAILEGLWSGEPFGFRGQHYAFEAMRFRPRPVQQPRIPIWVVGAWPSEKSMSRVARWDGLLPQKLPAAGEGPLTPDGPERDGRVRARAPRLARWLRRRDGGRDARRRPRRPRSRRSSAGATPARPGGSRRTGTTGPRTSSAAGSPRGRRSRSGFAAHRLAAPTGRLGPRDGRGAPTPMPFRP